MNNRDDDPTSAALAPACVARRTALLGAAAIPLLALGGCAFFDNLFGDTKKHLPGKREDVLPVTEGLQAPHGLHPDVVLPAPVSTDWPVQGGTLSHDAGNAALPSTFKQVWSSSIGSGSAYRKQVTSTPIVVGDTVFTMDSRAVISAFSTDDGKRLWRTDTKPKKSRTTDLGGGISWAAGTIYASTGYSEVLALNAETGAVKWRKDLETPARSAPAVALNEGGGLLYVVTIDQELLALSVRNGELIWRYDGTPVDTTLLGQPAPAYGGGIVLSGFGSGDLVALRADSGAVAWSDSIAAGADQVGVAMISAITGQPIILGEIAIAIGTGGLMVAVDLRAGRRLWEREVSGNLSPVAAGDYVFVTTQDQQVAALLARTGEVAWLTQLPLYKRPKSKGAPITWTGPVLAGGQLIYGGMRDDLIMVDAVSGKITRTLKIPGSITVNPIAAHDTLYLLTDDGLLRAYR
jgi:outer membrane protein assembly factor BamB